MNTDLQIQQEARSASTIWTGSRSEGEGRLSTESGTLRDAAFSFRARYETRTGTNPEELLAAAHSASYAMALSDELARSELSATQIEVKAVVTLSWVAKHWTIDSIKLNLKASLHGSPSVLFLLAASRAKLNCNISRVLSIPVTVHSELQDFYPGSRAESEVVIYTSSYCQICGQAKELLVSKGIEYREVDLDQEPSEMADALKRRTGLMSVPQIFVGEHFIGTYDDLIRLDADHGLKALLGKNLGPKLVPLAG